MKLLLGLACAGIWCVAAIAGYHVFWDRALKVEYICAGPQPGHYLPDPGPPASYRDMAPRAPKYPPWPSPRPAPPVAPPYNAAPNKP